MILKNLLKGLEERLAMKAVFSWNLPGNSGDHDSELDLQVRRAFKKTPLVFLSGFWYHTAAGSHELLENKAGVQMRNFGVDFLFFGNVWDFAGFGLPGVHHCGWTCKTDDALDKKEISSICRELRRGCNASWAVGIRLVSKNPYRLDERMLTDLKYPEGTKSLTYLFRVCADANVNPGAPETKVPVGEGDDADEFTLKTEICCEVCITRGPKSHPPNTCPKMASINKIRDQKGYVPIVWDGERWNRNDVKVTKSVETRMDALEKDMAAIKAKVGVLENQIKQKGKRKAEDPPAGGKPPKKQKGNGKGKEKAADKPPVAVEAEGEKPKKKRKRGNRKGGKKATADAE